MDTSTDASAGYAQCTRVSHGPRRLVAGLVKRLLQHHALYYALYPLPGTLPEAVPAYEYTMDASRRHVEIMYSARCSVRVCVRVLQIHP